MNIPKTIIERLETNELVAKKFHDIEASILNILNFQDFFEGVLTKISRTFQVPHVWLSIIRESSIAPQILTMEDSDLVKAATNFMTQKEFMAIAGPTRQPILANKDLYHFSSLFPAKSNYKLGSIAIAPISLDGVTIGSLNQGDIEPNRFMPGMDTEFLSRLALKISLCLSNVAAHEQLRHLAFHDPLTGLLNRRVMETILEREFQRSKRYHSPLSVIFLDLDHFKAINDTFGHDHGDKALICFAKSLNSVKRANDIPARFAGDEFVVILPSTTKKEANNYVIRLESILAQQPLRGKKSNFHLYFSSGISSISDPGITLSGDLLKLADQRLYLVKTAKKKTLTG